MADMDYQVLNQKQETNLSPSGQGFTDDWVISYRVTSGPSKGTVGTVTIQEADHNAEYIDRAIREKLSDLHAIASLGQSQS